MYSVGVIMGSWGLIKSEESQAYFHLVESGVVAAAVVLTAGGASSRGEKKRWNGINFWDEIDLTLPRQILC